MIISTLIHKRFMNACQKRKSNTSSLYFYSQEECRIYILTRRIENIDVYISPSYKYKTRLDENNVCYVSNYIRIDFVIFSVMLFNMGFCFLFHFSQMPFFHFFILVLVLMIPTTLIQGHFTVSEEWMPSLSARSRQHLPGPVLADKGAPLRAGRRQVAVQWCRAAGL